MKTLWRVLAIVTIAGILGFGLYSVMQYTGVAAPVAANAGKQSALVGMSAPADAAAQGGAVQGVSGQGAAAQGGGAAGGPGARSYAPLSLGAKLAAVGLAFAEFAGAFAAAAAALAFAKRLAARGNKALASASAAGFGSGQNKKS